jgi:hypothetical protein
LGASTQELLETMKEHKGPVLDIRIRANDAECATASADGSCIVWDLLRFVRNQILFANTVFHQVGADEIPPVMALAPLCVSVFLGRMPVTLLGPLRLYESSCLRRSATGPMKHNC